MFILTLVVTILTVITARVVYERGPSYGTVNLFLWSVAGGAAATMDGWFAAMGHGLLCGTLAVGFWLSMDSQITGHGFGKLRPHRDEKGNPTRR